MSWMPNCAVNNEIMWESLFRSLRILCVPQLDCSVIWGWENFPFVYVWPLNTENFASMFFKFLNRRVLQNVPKAHRSIAISWQDLVLIRFIKADVVARVRCLEFSDHLHIDFVYLADLNSAFSDHTEVLSRSHRQLVLFERREFDAVVAQSSPSCFGQDGKSWVSVLHYFFYKNYK